MNSDEYESHVAQKIEDEIKIGNLPFDPKLVVVKRKPSYYSRDRQKEIIFDASVEVTRKGASEPFLFWVIECKHYGHNVPVDDAEEFHSKLEQIGADKTKGTMVTLTGFSSGTVEYSRSKGIGLWRYDPNGEIVYVVEADTLRDRAILFGLVECDFPPQFFGLATNGLLSVGLEHVIYEELASIAPQEDAEQSDQPKSR